VSLCVFRAPLQQDILLTSVLEITDWMSLKDRKKLDLGRDDVFKVDVKEGFSFFNTDPEHTDKVMEVLNNVQLEGRRINVEISKMMVAEDVITTEEVLVVVVLVAEEVLLKKSSFAQREGSGGGRSDRTQVLEGGWWKKLCSKRRRFWRKKFSSKR
jgi:ATP-dependent RNA helicase DeaD